MFYGLLIAHLVLATDDVLHLGIGVGAVLFKYFCICSLLLFCCLHAWVRVCTVWYSWVVDGSESSTPICAQQADDVSYTRRIVSASGI